MASADLGGLGAKEGSPVEYTWILPSVAPQFLPWLGILGLLALKRNRHAAAWLVWLPLGLVALFTANSPIPLSGADFFLDVIAALAFGVAAVWLISNYLQRSHRILTFMCFLVALGGFSAIALVAIEGLSLTDIENLPAGMVLASGVLASTVALSAAGWICRRRLRMIGVYLWLCLLLVLIWALIALPFFLIAMVSSGGRISWSEFFIPTLSVALGNFILLLPFLILSSASPFFGERLKALLNIRPASPPVLPEPGLK